MLVVMAGVFLATHWAEGHVDARWGYVRAFAEAAMVGGLADWFAVTALFRHPLGLPIPHTAIIPRNKDRIGDTMAQFLRSNFLTPLVVARRMRTMNVAGAAGRFLVQPTGGEGRLAAGRVEHDRRCAGIARSGPAGRQRQGGAARFSSTSSMSRRCSARSSPQRLPTTAICR